MHRFKRLHEVALASVSPRKLARLSCCRKFVSARLGTAQWSWVTWWRPAKTDGSCIKTHKHTPCSCPKSLCSRPKRWHKPLLTPLAQSHSTEANSSSAGQEIPRILWNPKVHDRVHNSPRHVPAVRQTTPVHSFATDFCKIHLSIILPFRPRSSKRSLSFRLPNQTLYAPLLSPTRATWPVHLTFLDFITWMIFCEQETVMH